MTFKIEKFKNIVNTSKVFLIIGASTGESDDDLFLNKNLDYCVLIEPLMLCFNKLKEKFGNNPKYQLFNCAITDKEDYLEMYTTDEINHPIIGSSSLVDYKRNNIVLALQELDKDPEKIKIKVKCTTILNIKQEFKTTIYDVIQIDTEGCDFIVFNQLIENNISFKAIQLETMWLNREEKNKIATKLNSLNYVFNDDGCNLRGYLNDS